MSGISSISSAYLQVSSLTKSNNQSLSSLNSASQTDNSSIFGESVTLDISETAQSALSSTSDPTAASQTNSATTAQNSSATSGASGAHHHHHHGGGGIEQLLQADSNQDSTQGTSSADSSNPFALFSQIMNDILNGGTSTSTASNSPASGNTSSVANVASASSITSSTLVQTASGAPTSTTPASGTGSTANSEMQALTQDLQQFLTNLQTAQTQTTPNKTVS